MADQQGVQFFGGRMQSGIFARHPDPAKSGEDLATGWGAYRPNKRGSQL
jgi:hypothetical protein